MDANKVYHPEHYTQGGVECITAIKSSMDLEGFAAYCKGNVLKYLWRYEKKGGLEDLEKAQVYLKWLIDAVTERNAELEAVYAAWKARKEAEDAAAG